jgi:hypothetical protein
MKRVFVRGVQGLLVVLVVLYLADWAVWRLRSPASVSSSVDVQQFLRSPLKNRKEEFDYMGTVAQSCFRTVFPHNAETPCWWLERHKIQWVSP